MYTAAIISPLSAGLLRWIAKACELEDDGFLFKTGRNEEIPHHMTINLGPIDTNLNAEKILEQPARLSVDQICWSEELGVCAARVTKAEVQIKEFPTIYWDPIQTINDHPHVTICIKKGAFPVLSNRLFESEPDDFQFLNLDEVYILDAVVDVCA